MKSFRSIAVAALCVASLNGYPSSARSAEVPDFELESNADEVWRLSDYDGQAKLIMFWATWCPYCKKLFPRIQALHEAHELSGLKVVAISIRDDGDTISYAKQHNLTMDILVEGDVLAMLLNVPGTPAVVLLDDQNRIVYATLNSDPDDSGLPAAVEALLGTAASSASP